MPTERQSVNARINGGKSYHRHLAS